MAGVIFASTDRWWLLLLAGTVGVVSPSGHEVGPFLAIEQAALAQLVADRARTDVFAWYALTGSLATALGSLAGGLWPRRCGPAGAGRAYRSVVVLYAAVGGVLALAVLPAVPGLEPAPAARRQLASAAMDVGLHARARRYGGCPRSSAWIRSAAASSCRDSSPTGSTCGSASTRRRWAHVLRRQPAGRLLGTVRRPARGANSA